MNDLCALIEASVARLFSAEVDRKVLESFEQGRWQQDLWQLLEETGFHRVASESGSGAEMLPVLRAVGTYCVPLPLAETLVGNWLLARSGLPVADGPLTIIQCSGSLRLIRDGQQSLVDGLARRVPWAEAAQRFVVSGEVDGNGMLAVVEAEQSARLHIERGTNVACEPRDTVAFDRCVCSASAIVDDDGEVVRRLGATARAAAMAGAIEAVLDRSVQFANERVQFGKPIAKFQAIQHQLAQLACESIAANAAAAAACEAAGTSLAWTETAAAKARAGMAAELAATVGHQVHGAIGFTHEYFLQFLTRRLWSWRSEFGNGAWWARQLGSAAIRAGSKKFWADMTVSSNAAHY